MRLLARWPMIDDDHEVWAAYWKDYHHFLATMSEPDPDRHAEDCRCYACQRWVDLKDNIYSLPADRQQELYTWMHDILNLRRWK